MCKLAIFKVTAVLCEISMYKTILMKNSKSVIKGALVEIYPIR
jgi:hypothetical protein